MESASPTWQCETLIPLQHGTQGRPHSTSSFGPALPCPAPRPNPPPLIPQAQDFTFATEGGLTFEEWVDGAADRAMKVEEEERARREVAEREAKAAAAAAALKRDEDEARAVVDGEAAVGGWP